MYSDQVLSEDDVSILKTPCISRNREINPLVGKMGQ
jgi:hypothetical protein